MPLFAEHERSCFRVAEVHTAGADVTFALSYRRIVLLCLCAVYASLFRLSYEWVESPLYSYTGLAYSPPSSQFVVLGFAMALLPALFLPVAFGRPSHIVYWWLYLVLIVPSMFVPYHVLSQPSLNVAILPCTLLALFVLLLLFDRLPDIALPRIGIPLPWFYRGLILVGLVCVGWILTTQTAPTSGGIYDSHELRMSARDVLPGGSWAAYLIATIQHCIGPILVAYGIARRRPVLWCLGLAVAFCCFCIAGEKTLLALPCLMLAVGYTADRFGRYFGIVLTCGVIALVAAAILEYRVYETSTVSAYGSRRVLVVPAQLTTYYWEYFSSHPHNYFAGGSIGRMLGRPATLNASQTIGLNYFGTSEANANANIWMSAFSEAGYAGMVVVTICAGVLLKFFDGILRHSPIFGSMIVACMATAWAEGAFQTSLLSRGVAPTLVVLLFVPVTLALPKKCCKRPFVLSNSPDHYSPNCTCIVRGDNSNAT
jgi:hypothetical protein